MTHVEHAATSPHDANREIIQIRSLTKGFQSQVLFDGLNLDVFKGEVLGIVGGSGQGKSVLLP